jgi:hypothetical protein
MQIIANVRCRYNALSTFFPQDPFAYCMIFPGAESFTVSGNDEAAVQHSIHRSYFVA